MLKFTFTGTGTSQGVPVIGCECEVCKSADSRDNRLRTSGLLEVNGKTFVFDTGPDFRTQMLRSNVKVLDAVIYTHQHKDHTAGLDDVRAYNFLLRRHMPIYANAATITHLKREYYYIFEANNYPALPRLQLEEITDQPFTACGVDFLPIPVMHKDLPVWGYRIGDFAYVTDTNFISESSIAKLQNLDILVLDALRIKSHPSHFSLSEAIEVTKKLKPKKTYFTHISHLMGKYAEVNETLPDNIELAYDLSLIHI